MDPHPYGWTSLLPPLVAIGLAIATRRVVISLFFGVLMGAALEANGGLVETLNLAFEEHLWKTLIDADHLRVFWFTGLMGAMIGVVQKSGGMRGVVRGLAPFARSRRGGQLLTWALGLIVFIDDYANSLLLGHTMRPVCDRLRISREKLAYLVDSTAAPVSGLALVSTWVAGELANIDEGLEGLEFVGGAPDSFALFIVTIPYRFYVLLALLMVPLVALLNRDFGPMLRAERAAIQASAKSSEHADESRSTDRWWNAVIPILTTVGVTVWLLYLTGVAKVDSSPSGEKVETQVVEQGVGEEPLEESGWRRAAAIFGNGDSYIALMYGSLIGLVSAVLLALLQRILTWDQTIAAAGEGARLVIPAMAILALAWSLSGLTSEEHLGTGDYLASLLERAISAAWMPTIVFLLAFAVAFATGTSWGTMSILMPLVIQATHGLLASEGPVDAGNVIFVSSVAGVLSGAIFGDHCSPISDTTVLSSQASGCNHIAHVWTQMPYAAVVGSVAVLFGTIPVGFGAPVWPMLLLGAAAIAAILLLVGRPVADAS